MNSSHLKPTKTTNNYVQLYMPVVLSRQWTEQSIVSYCTRTKKTVKNSNIIYLKTNKAT